MVVEDGRGSEVEVKTNNIRIEPKILSYCCSKDVR